MLCSQSDPSDTVRRAQESNTKASFFCKDLKFNFNINFN